MSAPIQKMLVVVLGIAVVGGIGLGYCSIAYSNGVDPLKDGALMAFISAATVAMSKLLSAMGGTDSK